MFKTLQIEWMKIKNYRVFQVFSGLYLAGILLIIYIFYKVYLNLMSAAQERMTGVQSEGSDLFNLFGAGNIWGTVCFSTSFLLYLPGMIMISLFVNEVNFKTHRQNIIDGWKRETFIYSKIGLIAVMAVIITIMNFFAGLIMFQATETAFTLSGIEMLIYAFLQAFLYLMFALMLAIFLRKSGVAIIIFFVYGLIFEALFAWLLGKITPGLGHFLPLQVSDSLVLMKGAKGSLYQNIPDDTVLALACIAYSALFISLAVRKYKYDDL